MSGVVSSNPRLVDPQALERQYQLLFESNPEPMWVVDAETQRFLAVNAAAVRTYGYSRDEFLAMSLLDIRPPEEHAGFLEVWRASSGGPETHAGVRHCTRDGTIIEVDVSMDALEFGGRPAKLVLVKDVTERRRLEAKLQQAQKMEAVGLLAGGIAHDFNNLLTVIAGHAELMLQQLEDDAPPRGDVSIIQDAVEQAASLTRQLLAFSRQQVLRPEVLDLNALLSDTGRLLGRLIGEDVELRTVLASGLGTVQADRVQLQQVVMNLAVNARDAMPQGGILTLETHNVEVDNSYVIRHSQVKPGSYVLLAVSDTGLGMTPEVQARIFEPFFTTKERGRGTGLGLATVYGIVKQSGGFIWVYSESGIGTTFKIYLPRLDAVTVPALRPNAKAVPTAARREPAPGGAETILLVEDEQAVRSLACKVLQRHGYTVLSARCGTEALEMVASGSAPIQLLVTDFIMPGMTGGELASRLRADHPNLKVLFVSGYTGATIFQADALGAATLLQKPFSVEALVRTVREALNRDAAAT